MAFSHFETQRGFCPGLGCCVRSGFHHYLVVAQGDALENQGWVPSSFDNMASAPLQLPLRSLMKVKVPTIAFSCHAGNPFRLA